MGFNNCRPRPRMHCMPRPCPPRPHCPPRQQCAPQVINNYYPPMPPMFPPPPMGNFFDPNMFNPGFPPVPPPVAQPPKKNNWMLWLLGGLGLFLLTNGDKDKSQGQNSGNKDG